MFAIYADKPDFDNPLSALVIGECPEPKLLDDWIRVKVSAVALNWHDLWTLRGMGMRPIAFPMILGCDGAGTLDDGAEILIFIPLWATQIGKRMKQLIQTEMYLVSCIR